jgi:hypothetical protein
MAITKTTKYEIDLPHDGRLEIEPDIRSITIYKWADSGLESSIDLDLDTIDDLIAVLTAVKKDHE